MSHVEREGLTFLWSWVASMTTYLLKQRQHLQGQAFSALRNGGLFPLGIRTLTTLKANLTHSPALTGPVKSVANPSGQ